MSIILSKFFDSIVEIMKKHNYVNDDNYEFVRYGFELLCMKTIIYMAIIIIGIITKSIIEILVFMLAYQPLRRYCGGYHAKTRLICVSSSILMLCFLIFLGKIIPNTYIPILSSTIMLIGGIIIFLKSPVETPTKPLDEIERVVFRRRSFIVLIIIVLISIIAYLLKWNIVLLSVSFAIASTAFLLLIGKVQKK